MFSHWTWLNDMHFFYNAADLITSGRGGILYDPAARLDAGMGHTESSQVFPYPVTLAYLYWPLTLTDIVTARYIFIGVSIIAMAGVALAGWVWSKDLRFALLLVLLPASSFTFYEAMRFNQLAPVLSLLLCVSMISAISPASLRGGVINGLLVIKPSIAALPLLLLTMRRSYLQVAVAAVTGAVVFILIPLAAVGIDGMREYMDLLSRYSDESFKLDGEFTAGAAWMLGWQAIVGRLQEDDPSRAIVLPLCAVSVLLMIRIWWRGDWLTSWLAAVLTTLLVVPHVVWYDWMLLMGVAPFVAYHLRSGLFTALLLLLSAAISFDSYLIVSRPVFDAYPVPTPLIATAVMLYLAFAPLRATPTTPAARLAGQNLS